jgi:hypothetical protein
MLPPDSVCTLGTCTFGGCTPSRTWPPLGASCNSWQISAGFAAQGVEIAD